MRKGPSASLVAAAAVLALAILVAPGPVEAGLPPNHAQLVGRVIELVNKEREQAGGLGPLAAQSNLSQSAQGYAQVLAPGPCWEHNCGPEPVLLNRLVNAGYTGATAWAENIARGQQTPEAVMTSWMNSAGHRANILGAAYRDIGVGVETSTDVYGLYWVQNFGVRSDATKILAVVRLGAGSGTVTLDRARRGDPGGGVVRLGAGSGTVTASGLNCGADCTEKYSSGTGVSLSTSADAGSTFGGWGGACSGTGACNLTMSADAFVLATFNVAPTTSTLTVSKTGTGSGTITGSGINCGADCTETYANATFVTLTAAPAAGSVFAGWSGACSGTGTCNLTMDAAKSATATFNLAPTTYSLTVTRTGSGSGAVTSSPAGIDCGVDCTETYAAGTGVGLTATPAAGSAFAGWSGACSGTGACNVTMDASKSVTATFNALPTTYSLTVSTAGTGSGTVTSNPGGITCGADCTETYAAGTGVGLTATPAAGSTFAGWGGACSDTGACNVTMSANRAVTATFNLVPGGPPNDHFANATVVSPNALPRSYTGTNTANATTETGEPLAAAETGCASTGKTVWWSFTPAVTTTLTIDTLGTDYDTMLAVYTGGGYGALTRTVCNDDEDGGRQSRVTFSAVGGTTYRVQAGGYGGAFGNLTVRFSAAANPMLTVTRAGSGSGTVTSNPAGITCGADCTETYAAGTGVGLTATPAAGSVFAGWSGACTGVGACNVTMDANKSVTATFNALPTYTLTVSRAGTGSGTVTSNPAGITCGADCTESYLTGTVVGLTPTPAGGSVFAGWSGACTGVGACNVTMDASKSVTATFNAAPSGPPNDSFAAAAAIGGLPATRTVNTGAATTEGGEPLLTDGRCGGLFAYGKSVWYSFTPSSTTLLTISTDGSDFDTLVSVYTGSAVGGLTRVVCDDDSGAGAQSRLTFVAVGGTTYRVQVAGIGGAAGNLVASLSSTPLAACPAPSGRISTKVIKRPPHTVSFNAAGVKYGKGPTCQVVQAWWAFGDGTFGTGRVTTHTYATAGTRAVSFLMMTNGGWVATANFNARAAQPPGQAPPESGSVRVAPPRPSPRDAVGP